MKSNDLPVFVTCRDRVSDLTILVKWLERLAFERVYLIDNDSTYEPLLQFYEETWCNVIKLEDNFGHIAAWSAGLIESICPDQHFVVTDPDIIPVEECPDNAVDYFMELLCKEPSITKVGFGLKIDDLPDSFRFKEQVVQYEKRFWDKQSYPDYNHAPIDTTFALYKPGSTPDISFCIRTCYPYVARHMPWYIDSANLTEEEIYYRHRASDSITSWNKDHLPHWWTPS